MLGIYVRVFFFFFLNKILAKHFETSKIAAIVSPQDNMEQMDPWASLPLVPIPQASVGIEKKKNLHFHYHWSEAWERFRSEPLNSSGQCYF